MITKLFPLLVASPLCVDMDGAPISYESYGFSPRQASHFKWSTISNQLKTVFRACLRCLAATAVQAAEVK